MTVRIRRERFAIQCPAAEILFSGLIAALIACDIGAALAADI